MVEIVVDKDSSLSADKPKDILVDPAILVKGLDGRDGRDGEQGIPGIDGRDGRDGVDGKDGRDGLNGKDGVSFWIEYDEKKNVLTFKNNGGLENPNPVKLPDKQAWGFGAVRGGGGVAIEYLLKTATVTLTAVDWSSKTQSVEILGMKSTSYVWVSPAGTSMKKYADAGVYCSAQAKNSLTFTCDTEPTSDLVVQVVYG